MDKLDILYGKPGVFIDKEHGHLVMGDDENTEYLHTLDQKVRVDDKKR